MAGMAWASAPGGTARRDHELSRQIAAATYKDAAAKRPVCAPPRAARSRMHVGVQPRFRPHKGLTGIDQTRSIVASQAWAPLSSIVTANIAGSMDVIDQPSTKAARSSACDTRRGPQSPGWRSLKHIM